MASPTARDLIAAVRDAVAVHAAAWRRLVPDAMTIDCDAEQAEELAFLDMALAKAALRDHLAQSYGVPFRELVKLAAH